MSKFKVGDKVICVNDKGWTKGYVVNGGIYTVVDKHYELCLPNQVSITCVNGPFSKDFFKFQKVEEQVKQIKPEDEITITTTYGELARIYAILGNANGADYGKSLWKIASEAFNDSWEETRNKKFWEFDKTNKLKEQDVLDYRLYQKEWEKLLFNQKSEKDLKIEELEKTIAEAQKQLQELKLIRILENI